MKKKPEYIEGNQALENFERALDKVVNVPHREIKAKMEAEKTARANRPKRQRKQLAKK